MRARMLGLLVVVLNSIAVVSARAQRGTVVTGRAVDSAGAGVRALIIARSVADSAVELGRGTSDSSGTFTVKLTGLPARVVLEAIVSGIRAARVELDSVAIRKSKEEPVVLRLREPHALSPVRVTARYQKRPSVYNFMESEPSSRVESINQATQWLDPLSMGDISAVFRSVPDMLVNADGSASLLGSPSSGNQLQLGGMKVPAGLVIGLTGASVTGSPWDITIGGASGATANVESYTPRPNHSSYIVATTGLAGVPNGESSLGGARGVDMPVQVNLGSSGPVGKFGYYGSAFFRSESINLARWPAALDMTTRSAVDSISDVLGTPTINANSRSTQGGVLGRFDFFPYGGKRILALSTALTRSQQTGGMPGEYFTGSLGSAAAQDVGSLQLESKNVLQQRVLLTSTIGASVATSDVERDAIAPTIILTDVSGGNAITTGGASPQSSSRVVAAEARSTGVWYSRDNKTRYVVQLQARGEDARLGETVPHSTFVVSSVGALQAGQAVALTRESGTIPASASSFVFAPAIGARHDLGPNGSLLVGIRADAWTTQGIETNGSLRRIDVSPRVSLYQRLGQRSANRGPIASLRIGAGRFTNWPDVQQWADAWSGAGATRQVCSGADVPALSLDVEAAPCVAGGVIQTIGRTIAASDLRPSTSNRADGSLTFGSAIPGIMLQLGAAVAQNTNISVRPSSLIGAPVLAQLAGDGGRALLVSESQVGADGVVGVAQIPADLAGVSFLTPGGSSSAEQWRVKIGSSDSFQRVTWTATYVLTTGRQRFMSIASPTSSPGFVSGPLSAGGRHSVAFSLGTWIGSANVRIAGLARSGVRFTPLADRDLNGDGLVNDAAFIPKALANSWADAVSPNVRPCVRESAGRIAGFNSCTGPWSVSSLIYADIPGLMLGLPRGYNISVQLSNPLAVFAGGSGVTFGNAEPVSATLVHITGFDPQSHSFTGQPLVGFGKPSGLAMGISDPMRIAVGIHIPLGPSIISQRTDKVLALLQRDSSAGARSGAGMEYMGDIPPIPLMVLQSADALQLTAPQRKELQALGSRWMATASRLVLSAYGAGPRGDPGGTAAVRVRLTQARVEFFTETTGINYEIRKTLTADQIDLLPDYLISLLNPRFWKYVSLQDAGDF